MMEEPAPKETETLPPEVVASPRQSFSLSALFLLMVTVATLFGLIRQAFSGVEEPASSIQSVGSSMPDEVRKGIAIVVLSVLSLIIGSRRGWKLLRRKSGAFLGIFFGLVSVLAAGLILIGPPQGIMLAFCCVLLIITGYLLRIGQARQADEAEIDVLK